eukprot:gb/GECH01003744.1/.p1 GENE.gb/GECH01003744.1/~~gb/GECH01003744.1/.p1  ORF type:complete len:717 (+),score=168.77 gb/GECH01003744.1/:1-2151(+)
MSTVNVSSKTGNGNASDSNSKNVSNKTNTGPSPVISKQARYGNYTGTLHIYTDKVIWETPVPNFPPVVITAENLEEIRKHKSQPKLLLRTNPTKTQARGSKYDLTFESQTDTNICSDSIQLLMKNVKQGSLASKEQLLEKLRQVAAGAGSRPVSENMLIRGRVLASNKDLQRLHDKLVGSGVISDDEFWRPRRELLQKRATKEQQEVGKRNTTILAELKPMVATENEKMKFKVTPSVINQIKAEFPFIERAFRDLVPAKVSEDEFWTQILRSLHFHKNIGESVSALKLQQYVMDEKQAENERLRSLKVDRKVDLLSNEDNYKGYGVNAEHEGRQTTSNPVLSHLNKHSSVVLEGARTLSEDKTPQEEEAPKLLPGMGPQYVPLKISDKHRYFEGHSAKTDANGSSSLSSAVPSSKDNPIKLKNNFQSEVLDFNEDLNLAMINSQVSAKIVGEVRQNTRGLSTNPNDAVHDESDIPDDFKNTLLEYFDLINELLTHFWITAPQIRAKTTPDSPIFKRLQALVECMSKHYDDLDEVKKNLPLEKKSQLSPLVNPLHTMMDTALDQYDTIKARIHPSASSSTVPTATITSTVLDKSHTPSGSPMASSPVTASGTESPVSGSPIFSQEEDASSEPSTPRSTGSGISFSLGGKKSSSMGKTKAKNGGLAAFSIGGKKSGRQPKKRGPPANVFGGDNHAEDDDVNNVGQNQDEPPSKKSRTK